MTSTHTSTQTAPKLPSTVDRPLQVGYLGPQGSYSQQAANTFLAHLVPSKAREHYHLAPQETLRRLIQAVEAHQLDYAVIPVENGLEGAVSETVEAVGSTDHPFTILADGLIPIHHCLIGLPSAKAESVRSVISHPQALAQCRNTLLDDYGDSLHIMTAASTSEAVKRLESLNNLSVAAIGPSHAAATYNMAILKENIEDAANNQTRFLLIAPPQTPPLEAPQNSPRKTSVCFGMKDRTGILVDILLVFKAYGINLTRIESRPSRQEFGHYRFHVDMEGDLTQHPQVMMYLNAETAYLSIKGPYVHLNLNC